MNDGQNAFQVAWRAAVSPRVLRRAAWVLIAAGFAARLSQFLDNRALWLDEAVLAHHMLVDSTAKLFGPLGDCMAPPGYLISGKALIAILGPCEYAVRLPSIAAALAALVLFYALARRMVGSPAAVAGLAFMTVNAHLIYYAAEVRPYAVDTAMVLLILWLAVPAKNATVAISWPRVALLTLVGACAPWFSFPSVFALAGVGLVQLADGVLRKDARNVRRCAVAWTAWGVSLATLYSAVIMRVAADPQTMGVMNDYYVFAGAFVPLPPESWRDVKSLWLVFLRTFDNPGGLTLPMLGAFAWLAGCLVLLHEKRGALAFLLAPLAFALTASSLELYPFYARTILYVTPFVALPIGVAIGRLAETSRWRIQALAGLLAVLLLAHPAARAARNTLRPSVHHELKPLLEYARSHWQPGDMLYVPYPVNYSFAFCRGAFAFEEKDVIVEPAITDYTWEERGALLANQMPAWRARGRVWVPFTFDLTQAADSWWALIDQQGKMGCADEYRRAGAVLRLYTPSP